MATSRARTRTEALQLLSMRDVEAIELDYETGWQDAVELGRLGRKAGIRVEFRGQENIAVQTPHALIVGLSRPKSSFRQRNLYCRFDLNALSAEQLADLEAKASALGDYIFGDQATRDVQACWDE